MRKPKRSNPHAANASVRVIGYVRVSTDMQAQEGISLEAQRAKLAAYCIAQDLTLVQIVADEGLSAKTLERPGLRRVLALLERGEAQGIIVPKLDRLTRSVKDLGHLCDTYFREGKPWHLLSVSDAIDTRSAGGMLVLNVLMSVAQWEREAIGERTREGLRHLKQQGVTLGGAPYGWRYSEKTDAHGRRLLVECEAEQAGIRRICELYDADVYMREILKKLTAEGIPPRGRKWHKFSLYRVLKRAGYEDPERPRKSARSKQERQRVQTPGTRDKAIAATRAGELRAQGLSLRQIAAQLHRERCLPPRADTWQAAGILELLRLAIPGNNPPDRSAS
jgi:DNA invertase Pin-like site-specific DNA recombinase